MTPFHVFLIFVALQGSSPVGMILQTEGKVTVQRGTAQTDAKLADLLYAGDQVITATGRVSFLFCPSSERVSIQAGSTLELRADSVRVLKGAPPARTALRCALPRVALGAESMERVGGMRARGHPPISLFVGGPITTARPAFEWGPAAGATSFQLTLKNESGSVLWEHRTSSHSVVYPDSRPPLEANYYQWELRAEADGKTVAQQAANFEVKPHADLARPANDPASKLLQATELENAGYYAEAGAHFRELLRANPEDARISRRLAWLYWNAGLIAAANEQLEKLRPR